MSKNTDCWAHLINQINNLSNKHDNENLNSNDKSFFNYRIITCCIPISKPILLHIQEILSNFLVVLKFIQEQDDLCFLESYNVIVLFICVFFVLLQISKNLCLLLKWPSFFVVKLGKVCSWHILMNPFTFKEQTITC